MYVLRNCELTLNVCSLTYVSDDPTDLKSLTPAMFLHTIKETETPDIDILNKIDLNVSLKRKQLHGEKFISKLYFFYKKIYYFYSDAGTHSKCRIFTVLNSTF